MEKITLNKRWALNALDFLKGALLAVITSVLTVVSSTLENGTLSFDWKLIGTIALSTFVAYLGKNLVAKPSVTTTYDTNEKAEEVAKTV